MMRIVATPLTPKSFAPYGDVLMAPDDFGRAYFDAGLQTSRSTARPSLSVSRVRPLTSLPLEAKVLERHEFSSQSFLPLDVSRWLVVVAPSAADGGPDAARAVAFLAGPGHGVTYHAGTWHPPPADDPGSPGALRGGHVARRHEHGRRISHARRAVLRRARYSATLTSRGGKTWRE